MSDRRGETFVMQPEERIEFTTFLLGLASTTLVHLGQAPHPETGGTGEVDLALARQTLDVLDMLREKTRGNLTAEEEKVFSNLLADLKLRYVEASKK